MNKTLARSGIVFVVVLIAVASFPRNPPFQVVGHLASGDIKEIRRLARHEMMSHLLPNLDWDWDCVWYYGRHPNHLIWDVKDYRAQRILWGEVHADGSVTVFIGISKSAIRWQGCSVTFRKARGKWEIGEWGEFGCWSQWIGGPSVLTSKINIPPDL